MKVWGTVYNVLKGSGEEKREGQTKILKRERGKAGSRGGCLKKVGVGVRVGGRNRIPQKL